MLTQKRQIFQVSVDCRQKPPLRREQLIYREVPQCGWYLRFLRGLGLDCSSPEANATMAIRARLARVETPSLR